MTASTDIPIVYSTPLETRPAMYQAAAGQSLQAMLDRCAIDPVGLHIFVDDRIIAPGQYANVYPKSGDKIFICISMQGGGGEKNPIRTIAMIGVMIVAAYVSGGALSAPMFGASSALAGGTTGAAIAGMAVGMVGALTVNALIPPATADNISSNITAAQQYAITGVRNQFMPFESVPKTLGLDRVYPPYAANPYTRIAGQDQYVYMLFCLGRGPLECTDEKFGDTLCSNYSTKIDYGTGANLPDYYFDHGSITEDEQSILLDVESNGIGDYTELSTNGGINEIALTFQSPSLFYMQDDGFRSDGRVGLTIEMEYTSDPGTWYDVLDGDQTYLSGCSITTSITGPYVLWIYGDWHGGIHRAMVQFRQPYGGSTPREYNIRVRRIKAGIGSRLGSWEDHDPTDTDFLNDIYITSIQSILWDDSLNIPSDMYVVAVQAKATDELNSTPDNFNLMVQSHHPVYESGAYSYQATSNPAWIYADLVTGSANHRAVSQTNLDTDTLVDWAAECESNGYEFNATISNTKLSEIRRLVCAAGRAAPHQIGNKHTVIYDGEQEHIHQVFSPRNSWGFKGTKVFPERPHALRVSFRNKDAGYEYDERIVPDDGYSESTATKFESIEYTGIVDPEMIYKMARWDFAQSRLRPELFEINVDPEYLAAKRGQRVAIAHDVPMWGSSWPRIKTVETSDNGDGTHDVEITVDDVCTFEDGKTYAIMIRVNTDYPVTSEVDHPGAGETTTLTFTIADASAALIDAGNLMLFGESDGYSQDCIIKAIYPQGDFCARLELVEYNPDIYDDETVYGTIPEHDSNITLSVNRESLPPAAPVILSILSDESVLITQGDGTLSSRMLVSFTYTSSGSTIPATGIEAQYRIKGDDIPWISVPLQSASSGNLSLSPVIEGALYQVRLRTISAYGTISAWVTDEHTVIGKTTPPPRVTGLSSAMVNDQIQLSWTAVTVADLKDYEIRYGSSSDTWDTATSLGYISANEWRTPARWTNVRYFFIKARDTSGNLSTLASSIAVNIDEPVITNITADVVDNNVLIKWTSTAGSLPIDYVEIRRGSTFSTATVLGQIKANTYTRFETAAGQYKYWIVGIDTAGNYGYEQSVTVTVGAPPDYVLNEKWEEDFDDGDGTTNVKVLDNGTALAPINLTETVAEHFEDNSFTTTQDFIDAGYTYAAEPVPTSAEFYQEFDYSTVLSQSKATLDVDQLDYNSGPSIVEYLAEKELVGDSWNEDTDNPAYWTDFQYVRMRLAIASNGKTFCRLNNFILRLDSKKKKESGNSSVTTASTGVTVSLTVDFAVLTKIIVTAHVDGSDALVTAAYDYNFSTLDPTEFTVFLFDDSQAKTTGDFSWDVEGF